MNLEIFREYCLSKKGASEDFPFDETTLVFRVSKKIFALTDVEEFPFRIALKCEPERAIELREEYECISYGRYLDKRHWNSIVPDSTISDKLIFELIDHSYELVFNKLTKAEKRSVLEL